MSFRVKQTGFEEYSDCEIDEYRKIKRNLRLISEYLWKYIPLIFERPTQQHEISEQGSRAQLALHYYPKKIKL